MIFLLLLILSYLLGSIPFGLVLCRVFGYGDIRKIGSGNIGATNVLRTGNKVLAAATLLLDISKGLIVVIITRLLVDDSILHIFTNEDIAAISGFIAILGHNFPVWLKFKGGKGVATSIGTIIAIHPATGLCMIGGWLVTTLISRTSSLSALIAFCIAPLAAAYFLSPFITVIIYLICLLGALRHHANIDRLLSGTEPKISLKKS